MNARIASKTLGLLLFTSALWAAGCGGGGGEAGTPDGGRGDGGGGDGGGAEGGSAAPATAAAFCEQLEALRTGNIIRCFGGKADDWPIFFGPSQCSALTQAVTDNRVSYDRAKAAACLDKLAYPYPCDSVWPAEPCAASVLIGAVADGQLCDSAYVCSPQSTCTPPPVVDVCPGVPICRRIPKIGQPCDVYCETGATCVEGVCRANVKTGGACGGDRVDLGVCDEDVFCAPSDPSGTCQTRPRTGEACADADSCWSHQYCDTTGHCHDRLDVGGNCTGNATSCQSFLACDPATNRCVEASHVGQLCGNILGIPFMCQGGVCLPDASQVNHCVVPLDDGAACKAEYECTGGLCTNGKCASLPPNDGTPCNDSADCTSGLCVNKVCTARAANGAPCVDASECASSVCSGGKCAPPAADGAPCVAGSECSSGHCAAGKCAPCP